MESNMYHPQPSSYILPSQFTFDFEPPTAAPPPPGPSADLFSASETTDLFGFLDGFDNLNFDLPQASFSATTPPYPTDHTLPTPTQDMYTQPIMDAQPTPSHPSYGSPSSNLVIRSSPRSRVARTASLSPRPGQVQDDPSQRPLLSTPQKRMNHIMSEQKRRNAIRDGYAQLINIIAPAGSQCAIAMPSRGRPKGSGNRSKNKTQGKSGVLFRAVEYIHFLEEGRDALEAEVKRLEKMAGIAHP